MPKVSVLIPVYNPIGNYLQLAIISVLEQSFKDFELIIVNDSSTAQYVEHAHSIVKSFDDDRIRYYCNEKNLGISKMRNYLIDLAQGEYLAIMDHDDISMPERLEKQVEFLDAHPQYGVVSAPIKFMHSGLVISDTVDNKDIKIDLVHYCALRHPCAMLRKSALDAHQIRYEEEFTPAEDYALWCRLLPYTKFHNLNDILLHYRDHSDNTSHLQANRMAGSTLRIDAIMKETMNAHPLLLERYMMIYPEVTRVRLFGCIPFLKIICSNYRVKVKLFNLLTILSMRTIQRG